MSGILENVGVYGWQDIEPVILAAILGGVPLMLCGSAGTGKTTGAEALARGLYGEDLKYQSYYCPTLHPDFLTGPLNPEAYKNGRYEFLETPVSIWSKQVVCLDEPARAPEIIQNALLE